MSWARERARQPAPPDLTGLDCELVGVETARLPRSGWGLASARGIYYRPAGSWPATAFLITHYDLDFSQHYLADLLAHRGYGLLGWNTRFCGHDGMFLLDRALVDVALGVSWLREHGVQVVVLLGNSGGGSLLAAYQAQTRQPIVRPAHGLSLAPPLREGLPAGDLLVSVAAHPGRPEVLTSWLDPAVLDEHDPLRTDPALDMYNPDNGPPYPPEFVARYRDAQRARNRRISVWCRRELDRLQAGGQSDRWFGVHRTWADLRFVDGSLDASQRPTPYCYRGDPARANRGIEGLPGACSLRTWLSMWSLDDAQCSTAEALGLIDIPALVAQPTGDSGVFPSDARAIVEALGAPDKQLVELPGDHYFRGPRTARNDLADLIAGWVSARGGDPL